MLPCAGSRGRFGDGGIPMTVSFGSDRGRRSGARVGVHPLNMIHTKIAHAGIRVNVGRARTHDGQALGLVFGYRRSFFFYLERRAGHHVHPPIINSECCSLIAPPRLQQRRRGQGPRPQPPPRASPSNDQRDNTTMDRASMYHAVAVGNIIPHLCSLVSS
eukprot:scaffold3641_cov116-Isochrysis_galbana.AAC.1